MSFFTSKREKRLWIWLFVVLVGILATLLPSPALAAALRNPAFVSGAFFFGMFLVAVAVVVQGLRRRPSGLEVGLWLGVAGVYLLVFLRLSVAAERSHLIEYGVLALVIHELLKERAHQGRRIPRPALLALVATALIGVLDEGLQALVPGRVFDTFDMGFDALAATMAITASVLLSWARRRVEASRSARV